GCEHEHADGVALHADRHQSCGRGAVLSRAAGALAMARWLICGLWLILAAAPALAQTNSDVRAECIEGRRVICGRVLQISKAGLVVDSGYPTLLQPPLNHSWLTRAQAAPEKPAALVERSAPDAIAV